MLDLSVNLCASAAFINAFCKSHDPSRCTQTGRSSVQTAQHLVLDVFRGLAYLGRAHREVLALVASKIYTRQTSIQA